MKNLLDLPDDIIFLVLRCFILSSKVEELIRLEIICKRLRHLCLSYTCWVDALETLDTRPPLITARSSLLALNAADLRNEIIRAVKLDLSWVSKNGPTKTAITLRLAGDGELRDPIDILPLPEVDLIFVTYPTNRIYGWSASRRILIWEYVPQCNNDVADYWHSTQSDMKFACDVSDDLSTVTIALLFVHDRSKGERIIEVHRMDTHSFDARLLFESPPLSGTDIDFHDVKLRKNYIMVETISGEQGRYGIAVLDWTEGVFYRIREEMYTSARSAMTWDDLFFIFQDNEVYRLVGIRYRDVPGALTSVYDNWPSYNVEGLINLGVYSSALLPFKGRHASSIQAIVSTWSRYPVTYITLSFNTLGRSISPSKVFIFTGTFAVDADGRGSFLLKHKTSDTNLNFITAPSTTMRALILSPAIIGNWFTGAMAICYVPFGEGGHDGDKFRERRHSLGISGRGLASVLHPSARMDVFGRMVVYQSSSKKISVVRFDN